MYVRAGRPAFARPWLGIHKSTSLMIVSCIPVEYGSFYIFTQPFLRSGIRHKVSYLKKFNCFEFRVFLLDRLPHQFALLFTYKRRENNSIHSFSKSSSTVKYNKLRLGFVQGLQNPF